MPSEASWHPAFMPNSLADIIPKTATPPLDPAPAVDTPVESAKPISPPLTPTFNHEPLPADLVQENGVSEWDADADDNTGHPELTNLRNALSTSLASPGGVEFDEPPFQNGAAEHDPITQDKADFPSKGPSPANKHVSSMSFARTVSDEVSLGDDDEFDTEWNLSRTGTDPFKSMPKSDRTNSFPQVPASHSQGIVAESLPSQAEGIINEVNQEPRDLFAEEEEGDEADFFNQTAAQNFPGDFAGDVADQDNQESEARYEEGLPLVGPMETHQVPTPIESAFAGGDEEGDDFFAQVSQSEPAAELRPGLERKSTTQVMNSLNFQPHEQTHPSIAEDAEGGAISSSQFWEDGETNGAQTSEAPVDKGPEYLDDSESKPTEGDLVEKWQAALADDDFLDDDDLLPDDEPVESKPLDPADLFGSDDEGFLEDTEDQSPPAEGQLNGYTPGGDKPPGAMRSTSQPEVSTSRYLPANLPTASPQTLSPYTPLTPQFADLTRPTTAGAIPPAYAAPPATFPGQQAQPPRPPLAKAESFADKNKGGYSSPYDLPMEVVKPRKRPSLQQINRGYNHFAQPSPSSPPRSASMHQQPPPSGGSVSSLSPPTTGYSNQQSTLQPTTPGAHATPPTLKPKGSSSNFFEDLPVSSRPKLAARHSLGLQPQASHAPPSGPPPPPAAAYAPPPPTGPSHAPPPPANANYAPPPQQSPQAASYPTQGLVAPDRVSPYAPLPSQTAAVPAATSRYSPAPPQPHTQTAPPPPTAQSRYSPALQMARQTAPHGAAPPISQPPLLPHLPRTSSPLAHFERSPDVGSPNFVPHVDRRTSSSYESSLRAQLLPPTREVDEVEGADTSAVTGPSNTPPPTQNYTPKINHSPPRRASSDYLPQQSHRRVTPPHAFAPPKRSHTQSPGSVYTGNNLQYSALQPQPRSASTERPFPPGASVNQPLIQGKPTGRPRGLSSGFNYIAPTDGREHDPLQRWKGAPVFCWGVGGALITSFPQNVPRYVNQTSMTIRAPGEVKIRNIKDVDPLAERLSRFPGPLKGKSKKKDVIAWLNSSIQVLEQEASHLQHSFSLTHDNKRVEERILLWKILRVFIEHDGTLEGSVSVDAAVRAVLSPGLEDSPGDAPFYATGADLTGISNPASTGTTADPVDPAAVGGLRKLLLRGDREKAAWEAVDKRLWGHAMLISNTVSKDLFKQVAQEFIQKEVRNSGENTESLAALYEVFAGNFEESIDELVPPSARAGFQMVSTSDAAGPSKDALHGLDKWRETLGLVLSNRSVDDNKAINALGKLLTGYGRAEAGHICFLFARTHSVFGGIDDPSSNVVLIGSDHIRQHYEFDKELEPVLLSEVFEYGLSLSSPSNVAASSPHLCIYKLQHAKILAEYGYREKALQYCESIASSITSQTRRSPYHHKLLVADLDDLSQRLKQSPKDDKSSWVSKPSMDKVSSSVWSTFNKFVAGDEADAAAPGSAAGSSAELGPFARLAGGTPTISRAPSTSDLYGSYNGGLAIKNATATKAGSRYAPGAAYNPNHEAQGPSSYQSGPLYGSQPRSSFGEPSGEYQAHYPEPARLDSDYPQNSPVNIYAPQKGPAYTSPSPYAPSGTEPSFSQTSPVYTPQKSALTAGLAAAYPASSQNKPAPESYEPSVPSYEPPASSGYEPPTGGYEPPSTSYESPSNGYEPQTNGYEPPSNGYEPPSNGYEPPSGGYEPPTSAYEPPAYEPTTADDEPDSLADGPSKKKSFMDYDDDVPSVKPALANGEKTKAEKDREADEAFRKAAEADGMHDPLLLTVNNFN